MKQYLVLPDVLQQVVDDFEAHLQSLWQGNDLTRGMFFVMLVTLWLVCAKEDHLHKEKNGIVFAEGDSMTAALIIASGRRRNRDPFEPGLRVGTISAIQRIVLLFQQAGIREIVVCGEEEEVKKLVPAMNVVFLPCPGQGEMLEHIQLGIGYLGRKAREILICHVHTPMFSVQTVSALLASEGTVCIPSFHGRCGHPVLLRSSCFEEILAYRGENGLKGAIEAWGKEKTFVPVEDRGVLEDLTGLPEDSLISDHDLGRLRLSYKFRVGRESIFYGPGVHQLLTLTEELHSLAEACRYMGISYSKGRKILQTMEEQMGYPVLISRKGGKGGGCSQLTDQAKEMMERYGSFLQDAEGLLQDLFAKHFDSIK